ncbi:MAG TPA: ABC transporter permease [Gaiellaceae bacterium]|nr:ABC transporter permease [Gaiellaceae bacterium]
MAVYAARRAAWAVMLCLVVSLFTFVIFYVVPRGQSTQRTRGTLTDVQRAQQFSGPVAVQYAKWLNGVVHGSLGHSYVSRRPVSTIVREALPVTLALSVGGAVLWLLIALPLGVLSALRPRSLLDRTANAVVLVGISIHPLWLGLFLAYVFGYRLHLLPFTGYCDMFSPVGRCGGPTQWFTHLLMPWFTFALVFAALYVRMIRATVAETLQEDYVGFARAKGMSEWALLRRHVLPNAFIPVVPMVAMDISRFALPTALFVETAFGLPGLGQTLRNALLRNDLPVIVGVVVVTVVVIAIVNFLGEVAQALVDPRVKLRPEPAPA